MGYVALRPIKAQLGTERKITVVKPGEKVPGAENWRNIKALVQKGYLSFVDDGTPPQAKAKPAPVAVVVAKPVAAPAVEDHEDAPDELEEKKAAKKPEKAHHTLKSRR